MALVCEHCSRQMDGSETVCDECRNSQLNEKDWKIIELESTIDDLREEVFTLKEKISDLEDETRACSQNEQ
jgi:3-dehydroquinate synthase class II